MVDQVIDLNYDFNYNLFLAKSMLTNLTTLAERQKVARWIRKLISCNRTIDELKLRNDFLYYLVLNIQNGELTAPFTDFPPSGPLPILAHLLPEATAAKNVEQAGGWADKSTGNKSLLHQLSPDGGAFLASQPIPKCGAFCYMAVVSRNQNK